MDGPIAVSRDSGLQLAVTACRNGRCGSVDIVTSASDSAVSNVIELDGGGRFGIAPARAAPWWHLVVQFTAATLDEEFADGDIYVLQIVDTSTDVTLVDIEQKVTYEVGTNDGPLCGGPTCHHAVIELPPPPSP